MDNTFEQLKEDIPLKTKDTTSINDLADTESSTEFIEQKFELKEIEENFMKKQIKIKQWEEKLQTQFEENIEPTKSKQILHTKIKQKILSQLLYDSTILISHITKHKIDPTEDCDKLNNAPDEEDYYITPHSYITLHTLDARQYILTQQMFTDIVKHCNLHLLVKDTVTTTEYKYTAGKYQKQSTNTIISTLENNSDYVQYERAELTIKITEQEIQYILTPVSYHSSNKQLVYTIPKPNDTPKEYIHTLPEQIPHNISEEDYITIYNTNNSYYTTLNQYNILEQLAADQYFIHHNNYLYRLSNKPILKTNSSQQTQSNITTAARKTVTQLLLLSTVTIISYLLFQYTSNILLTTSIIGLLLIVTSYSYLNYDTIYKKLTTHALNYRASQKYTVYKLQQK